ncbi:MAG TPA: ferrochelatase [Cytophagales bacterium]|nr:ferrochelatase [Cytophagales bacterium]
MIGVLIINLGTPDSPKTPDVRRYLREFLMDWRVIDIPYLNRFALINFIIAPLRGPKSAHEYQKLWTPEGSPIKTYAYQLKQLLQNALGNKYLVSMGMRYQNPSIREALSHFKDKGITKLIVIPLYPQYASASTGSTIEKVWEEMKDLQILPEMHIVSNFPANTLFINAFAEIGKKYMEQDTYDHYLFTYHGLPERQILKGSCNNHCKLGSCCEAYTDYNQYCYRAQCYETSRHLAKALGISRTQYTVSFQSRLGKTPWIKPYTDEVIKTFSSQGIKKVLAFSPSFVADCLETTVEIGETYRDMFLELGGEKWTLVESLNDHPMWVECLKDMVLKNSAIQN